MVVLDAVDEADVPLGNLFILGAEIWRFGPLNFLTFFSANSLSFKIKKYEVSPTN
jgi:hypothetical protein